MWKEEEEEEDEKEEENIKRNTQLVFYFISAFWGTHHPDSK